MEKQLTPKQKARIKYEIIHKEEREKQRSNLTRGFPSKNMTKLQRFLKRKEFQRWI